MKGEHCFTINDRINSDVDIPKTMYNVQDSLNNLNNFYLKVKLNFCERSKITFLQIERFSFYVVINE